LYNSSNVIVENQKVPSKFFKSKIDFTLNSKQLGVNRTTTNTKLSDESKDDTMFRST